MKQLNPLLLLTVMLAACSTLPQKAATLQSANHAIVKQHIIPSYQTLADASIALEKKSDALCASPNQQHLDETKQKFHQTMDAWMAVQHLRNGPVEILTRYHRFQLWPDKHNTGSKQLAKLLAEKDMKALEADRFARGSVAVQGLSTLERLLFSNKITIETFGTVAQPSYHCLLIKAIAHNLSTMSTNLVNEWSASPTPFHTLFVSSSHTLNKHITDKDLDMKMNVTAIFYNNLTTEIQAIIDQKLVRPMQANTNKAKPRYTESWRSQRSLRNIEINLRALESLHDIGFAPLLLSKPNGEKLNKQIKQTFQIIHTSISKVESPLSEALKNENQRSALEQLVDELRQLQSLLAGPLSQTLKIPLGFNALDGD